jgi:hypothetical protein
MHLVRLTEQKLVAIMARQDLKKYCMHPHVSTISNICGPLLQCVHMAVRESRLAYGQPLRVHRCALHSDGGIILIYSYFIAFRICFSSLLQYDFRI